MTEIHVKTKYECAGAARDSALVHVSDQRNDIMIMLTKLNGNSVLLNCAQIESVELIPESKVVMMNGKFFIVKESAEEIIEKTIEYNGKVHWYDKNRVRANES